MQRLRSFLLLLGMILGAQSSGAICIHNSAELKQHTDEIPAVVGKLPTVLVAQNMKVVISEDAGRLKLDGAQKVLGHWFTDSGYMAEICSEVHGFKITLENKKTYDVAVQGPTSLVLKGTNLVNSHDPQFAAIMAANDSSGAPALNPSASSSQ